MLTFDHAKILFTGVGKWYEALGAQGEGFQQGYSFFACLLVDKMWTGLQDQIFSGKVDIARWL